MSAPARNIKAADVDMLSHALEYARRGWSVCPLHSINAKGQCTCSKAARCQDTAKHPRTKNGLKDATTDEATISKWWRRWPTANIGISTGERSFVTLDVDPKHGGDAALAELLDQHGAFAQTLTARTGGNGSHINFAHPGVKIKNVQADKRGQSKIGKGLDVRGDGGYIVAPPSLHASGNRYQWLDRDAPLAPMPAWLLEALTSGAGGRSSSPRSKALSDTATIIEGHRNTLLFQEGCRLRRYDASREEIERALLDLNARRCIPPLDETEVFKIAASAALYSPTVRRTSDSSEDVTTEASGQALMSAGSLATVEPRTFNQSDYGNAERLVYRHGLDLRFDHTSRKWLVWDGRRWREDATAEATRRAKETVRAMYSEAAVIPDQKEREGFVKFVLRSEADSRITAMLSSASSERGVPVLPEELDVDPFLFNCANGTLDLRTGKLRPHAREDLMTKLSPVAYDENARSDVWDKFLSDATGGDAKLATFLQRAAGYSLTGDTREEVLFFIHGPAAAGKSTFIEAIKCVLGDKEYAATADFEAFLTRHHVGGPRNDIARLAGARFVASIEVDEGKKLAEGLIKMLTGGDTVTARKLYQEAFEFRPAFKLWLAANHTPKVRDDDDAMWRRILTVPFIHTVEKSKRDPRIKAHLRDARHAGSAILAWMVRGCLDWQRDGLRVPEAVEEATAQYRESQDPLKDFISDCCTLTALAWISTSDLRAEYERWAKERGERHLLFGNAFTDRLKAYGLVPKKRDNKRGWQGIGLSDTNSLGF